MQEEDEEEEEKEEESEPKIRLTARQLDKAKRTIDLLVLRFGVEADAATSDEDGRRTALHMAAERGRPNLGKEEDGAAW